MSVNEFIQNSVFIFNEIHVNSMFINKMNIFPYNIRSLCIHNNLSYISQIMNHSIKMPSSLFLEIIITRIKVKFKKCWSSNQSSDRKPTKGEQRTLARGSKSVPWQVAHIQSPRRAISRTLITGDEPSVLALSRIIVILK